MKPHPLRPSHLGTIPLSDPAAAPSFYVAARRCQAQWCALLDRSLGCGNVRRAIRAADEATLALVYQGTLVADGQRYLPGYSPNQPPSPRRLKNTPLQAPAAPSDLLGLNPSNAPDAPDSRIPGPGRD